MRRVGVLVLVEVLVLVGVLVLMSGVFAGVDEEKDLLDIVWYFFEGIFGVTGKAISALDASVCGDSLIYFIPPTPENGGLISNELNISVQVNSNDSSAFINWDESLIAWFNFETGMESQIDSNDVGHCVNCPDNVNSVRGSGYYFDGKKDAIEVEGGNGELNLGPNITISMWINLELKPNTKDGFDHDEYHNLIEQWSDGGYLVRVLKNGELTSYPRNDSDPNNYYESTNTNYDLEWNRTYHIVYQIEEISQNSSMVRFYVNGENIYEEEMIYHVGGTNNDLLIGTWKYNENQSTLGMIDEVMLFNRILGPTEVKSLYNVSLNPLNIKFNNHEIKDTRFNACAIEYDGIFECTQEIILSDGVFPVVYDINISDIKSDSVTISWKTDTATNATINYGFNGNLDYSIYETDFLENHSIVIDKLRRYTDYEIQITATEITRNSVLSDIVDFKTDTDLELLPLPQNVVLGTSFEYIAETWVILTDTNNEKSMFSSGWLKEKSNLGNNIVDLSEIDLYQNKIRNNCIMNCSKDNFILI